MITLNGYELSSATFKITGVDFQSSKNIDVEDLESRHGSSINRFAYYDNLKIRIDGITSIDYFERSRLESILAYGTVKIEINSTYYIGQLEQFNILDESTGSAFQKFTMNFICDKPYAYTTAVNSATFTVNSQVPTVTYTNTDIQFPLDNVNFWMHNTGIGTPTIKLAGYLPLSAANDATGTATMTVASVTGFDMNNNSIGALFPTVTHISRLYIYGDTIATTTLNRSEMDIYYSTDSGVSWVLSENDYTFKIVNGSVIGKTGKFIEIDYVNLVCDAIKINYSGTSTVATVQFSTTATKNFDRLIVPEFYSSVQFADASATTTQYYFINPAFGIITKQNQSSIGSTKGNLFKLYPLKTYSAIYGTGTVSVSMSLKFNTFNIYEVT